jgi:hypothetical protein
MPQVSNDRSRPWWVVVDKRKGRAFYSAHDSRADAELVAERATRAEDRRLLDLCKPGEHRNVYSVVERTEHQDG